MKFLVLWLLNVGQPSQELIKAVAQTPNYAKKLQG